jgi:hypothetical protein
MWKYQNKSIQSIQELPDSEALYGYVYQILCKVNGRCYIGKKNFYSVTTKHFGKKELKTVTDKRLKTYKKITKESNWKDYWGTVNIKEDLVADIKKYGKEQFTRTIVALAYSKKELTFLELEHQIFNNVLRDEKSYNNNIAGKYFSKDLKRAS